MKDTSTYLRMMISIAAGCAAIFALLTTFQTGGVRAQGSIIYVDADAPGANDGSSWSDAYTSLQTALTVYTTTSVGKTTTNKRRVDHAS